MAAAVEDAFAGDVSDAAEQPAADHVALEPWLASMSFQYSGFHDRVRGLRKRDGQARENARFLQHSIRSRNQEHSL